MATTRNQRRARARKGRATLLGKARAVARIEAARERAEAIRKAEAADGMHHQSLTDGAAFARSSWQREAGAISGARKPLYGREAYASLHRTPPEGRRFKLVVKRKLPKRFSDD